MKKNIVKLLLGFCLLIAFALCPLGSSKLQAASTGTVKKKYTAFMKTQPSYVKYKIIDVTKDGVPELITKTDRKKAGNLKSHRFVIYTYADGKVKHHSTHYEKYLNLYYYPKTNILVTESFGKKGKHTYEYFKLTNSKDKLIGYSYYLKGNRHYAYNDKYCLKAAFDKHLKKLVGKKKMKKITF